jgi:hypothetical protein
VESRGVAASSVSTAERALLIVFPALKLGLHLLVGRGYGYHRDELYYLACAGHLDWGYVDHPPLSIVILAAFRAAFGDSAEAIRIVPAIAGALTVFLIGLMARRLGGGPFAMALAMTAALCAPFYLALDQYYSMNALDILAWATTAWLLVEVLTGGPPWLFAVVGAVLGLGLLNKISVLWLALGLGVGFLIAGRAWLRTPWPWIAGAIAWALFVPHVLWQARHGFPTLAFIHNATTQKMAAISMRGFLRAQGEGMLLPSAVVWLAGVALLLVLPAGRNVRVLGWAYVVVIGILVLSRSSRPYYVAPAYTWVLAAGGVAVERALVGIARPVRAALLATIAAYGAMVALVVLPILPPALAAAYARHLGAARRAEEKTGLGALPEFMAHMYGWDAIVESVAAAYRQLPEEERARAAVVAPNYGVAGAVEVLGPRYGLPPAVSGHNSFSFWGARGRSVDPAVVVGRTEAEMREWYEDVRRAASTDCGLCMPYENGQPIWIARRRRIPLETLLERIRYYQ